MATVTITAEDDVLNAIMTHMQELASSHRTFWKDEAGERQNRLANGFEEVAGQLIDQGFYG